MPLAAIKSQNWKFVLAKNNKHHPIDVNDRCSIDW